MTMTHVPAVRRQSIRVALAATGVVAIACLVIAAAVVLFATSTLTAQIDARLTQSFRAPPAHGPAVGWWLRGSGPRPRAAVHVPSLAWTIRARMGVRRSRPARRRDLPTGLYTVTAPQTATIDGTQFRVAGQRVGSSYVVVAQAMNQVTDAQGTIILGELIIAPILFRPRVRRRGRRAAGGGTDEAARQRQLEFTADASHELRTPLSVIEAHTSLALAEDRDAPWYRNAFTKVERESKRCGGSSRTCLGWPLMPRRRRWVGAHGLGVLGDSGRQRR